jgi:glycosyltransferase involved in cell wall biosynthesis
VLASIIVPTFNQKPEYLQQALTSAVRQTVPVEIIVVDDGSDALLDCTHPAIRVIRHDRNRGVSAALNTGIAAMQTDWFCWLPSDDVFAPYKVERQRLALIESGLHASFHQYYTFTDDVAQAGGQSLHWDWGSHLKQRRQLGVGCAINGLTAMVHRSVFARVGTFDESYLYGQDWEMWARIAHTFEWLPMLDVLAYRRMSTENLTARIAGDAELRRIRDEEDERIRKRYGL